MSTGVGRVQIPDGFLCVCRRGHVTAPGWMGQRQEPTHGPVTARACPKASVSDVVEGRHTLCTERVVSLVLYPELLAAHKLGGEEAVQDMLTGGYHVEWPPPVSIAWTVTA